MTHRRFGSAGFHVSIIGLGAGQLGDGALSEDSVGALLHGALDLGVTLIDTARGYGLSEERIGRHLAHRRSELVLSTKVGYGIPGVEDWTYDCVAAGVDEALRRMRTDYLDIVHLHSCPLHVLERGEVVLALERARDAGKVRVAAYSGENSELDWAVGSARFGAVQCSVNVCDQRSVDGAVRHASERGMGVIAKRSAANAPWRFTERPHGHYAEEYWHRWKTMAIDPRGLDWQELALRFAAFAPGVCCALVGTSSLEHLRHNVAMVDKGPLADDHVESILAAFRAHDREWTGQV